MKTIFLDIMLAGRFVFTLRYRYCPVFPLDLADISAEVIKKRPTLKDKPFEIYACLNDLV